MSNQKNIVDKAKELLEEAGGELTIDINDPRLEGFETEMTKADTRRKLANAGIVEEVPRGSTEITLAWSDTQSNSKGSSKKSSKPKQKPTAKKGKHSYVQPQLAEDIKDALLDDASHVLWFKGPTGSGKTVMVEHLSEELGFELYKVNCDGGLGPEGFFGSKTVEIDDETGQNKVVFKEGPVVQAMKAGLDENGNEVGNPGLLFLDEAGAIPPHVSIALNHLLESDNPRRTITLDDDGGRQVQSHSGFRVVLAANTAGRGATSMSESMYSAQVDALDMSLLNRITMTFKFGYDRNIEKNIAMEKMGDDRTVRDLMKLRNAIRENLKSGKLTTPFSTRHIVAIADAFRIYGDLAKALYYTTFEQLLPEEQKVYNELAVTELNTDILDQFSRNNEIDDL